MKTNYDELCNNIINGYTERQKSIIESRIRIMRLQGKSEEEIENFRKQKMDELEDYEIQLRKSSVIEDEMRKDSSVQKDIEEIEKSLDSLLEGV